MASERAFFSGAEGRIEVWIDFPAGRDKAGPANARGLAVIAHPHPQYGGTAENKVVQTLAKTFAELGYIALRPNFRGVGDSSGDYDQGLGETEDLLNLVQQARVKFGDLPVVLAGFSFGAFVQTRVAQHIVPERMVLIAPATGLVSGDRSYSTEKVPAGTLVIHGEKDETVPLENVLDWARPQELPIVVVPGADHFFHRRLNIIKDLVKDAWQS